MIWIITAWAIYLAIGAVIAHLVSIEEEEFDTPLSFMFSMVFWGPLFILGFFVKDDDL